MYRLSASGVCKHPGCQARGAFQCPPRLPTLFPCKVLDVAHDTQTRATPLTRAHTAERGDRQGSPDGHSGEASTSGPSPGRRRRQQQPRTRRWDSQHLVARHFGHGRNRHHSSLTRHPEHHERRPAPDLHGREPCTQLLHEVASSYGSWVPHSLKRLLRHSLEARLVLHQPLSPSKVISWFQPPSFAFNNAQLVCRSTPRSSRWWAA